MNAASDLPSDPAQRRTTPGDPDAAAAPADSAPADSAPAGIDPVHAALACLADRAAALQGQPEALLQLLRRIEQLHRTIQDGAFRASLPADRNALFQLLSEMERSGGWPYIPRLQLRTFLDLLGSEPAAADSAPPAAAAGQRRPPEPAAPDSLAA
jgi:hypothetical protein